jgi:hypothetical protein
VVFDAVSTGIDSRILYVGRMTKYVANSTTFL